MPASFLEPVIVKWSELAKERLKLRMPKLSATGEITGNWMSGCCRLELRDSTGVVVRGAFSGMPGCCGAAVIHEVCSSYDIGFALADKFLHEVILDALTAGGWSFATLTISHLQPHKVPIVEALGFCKLNTFINKRTNNTVTLWTKAL